MSGSNVCWGVEIGAGAIKAIKLESENDGVTVADFAIVPHAKVLSTPDLDETDAVRVALGQLAARWDLTDAPLAVSIPGNQSFARFAKLPPVEPKKVKDVVKFEAQQQVPFPLEDVEWDYQTFVSPDTPEVEVGIFAVARARIMERLQALGDLELTPEIATLSPIAAYNALAYDLGFNDETPGTIILDIGTTATDLVIAEPGRVWVRTFPIGGHQFTDALVEQFKLSYSKAERLKREAEQSRHARHAFQAMRPIFTDLVQEVQRSIGYYQSVHAGADLKRLIGLGSTFKLPGLRKYLKQQLQMDVYKLENFKRARIEGDREAEFEENAGTLATAYGLALQGLAESPLSANLMPVGVLRDAMWKRKTPWFGAAAGVAVAAGAAMFIRPLMDMTSFQDVKPTELQAAERLSRQLSGEAQDAGVVNGEPIDLTASRLLTVFTGREVYPMAVADVQRAVGAVEGVEVASVKAAWTFPQQGGGGGGFRPGGGFGGDPQGQGEPDPLEGVEHVKVTVVLRETGEGTLDQSVAGMLEWLEASEFREGVPYAIRGAKIEPIGPRSRFSRPGAAGSGQRGGDPLEDLAPLAPDESPSIRARGGGDQADDAATRVVSFGLVLGATPDEGGDA
ncbi:MAG: type IV pilus assembly protein PilM [Planctomycetota bacterium]